MRRDGPLGGPSNEVRRRMSLDQRDQHELAPPGFDLGPADDLLGPVVAPLDQHIGPDRLNQGKRGVVVEYGDDADGFEGGKKFGPGALGVERAGWALEASD